MKIHKLPDQSQTYAQAVLTGRAAPFHLLEDLENSALLLGRNADAIVADLHDGPVTLLPERKTNLTTGRRVFRGIAEKIADDLGNTGRVGFQPDRFRRYG